MSTRDLSQSIMRRKPLNEVDDEHVKTGLFRTLGLWQLTAIGVGGIIGIGIFTLAGLVANGGGEADPVGPAVLISFLIAGLASAAAALSYAEFAGMIPRAGSAYTYGYVALGEVIGWFIGWDLLLEYIAIVAVVAIGISGYFSEFMAGVGLEVPVWMQGTADTVEGGVINLPAIVVCLFITWILSRGTKTFGRFELVAVGLKVLLILFIIGLGFFFVNAENYTPFMPSGFGAVFAGAATVFFAVFGYDAMSTAAEEATDGKKHMPKAILLSLLVAMTLYVLATLVLTGMQNYTEISPTAGFASAFQNVGLPVIATIISAFAVLSILTVMLTFLLGVTRVWFAMSRDGLLPRWFSATDKHGTPQRVTWIAGIAAALLAGVFPIRAVADLTNIGILAAFVVTCLAVIVLRYKRPDEPRTFKLPLMPVVPAFGVIASLFLMLQLHWETWVRFGVWLVIGLLIYWFYGRRHSLMNPHSPRQQLKPGAPS
ncbi:amino acid permease-associated protein [Arthrobacter crystallopoietes BAB-32]|uniref:Amino acid permease-associated protein n=1 Tax=Arthrobacter crystallopoietes BAB-32 TaxID=1246476 RepID=N1UW07_9MICC|nr:amino acid permease [Arthrobacter crystallopoietes]EMY33230.1 amino acid permease-associated protein [Arthrobacter crystallopoietes BAB-32]